MERTVIWVDASVRWDNAHKVPLEAGIAVVDAAGGILHTESVPRMGVHEAERLAVRRGIAYAKGFPPGAIEIRTDSNSARRGFKSCSVRIRDCHRDHNLAHSAARVAAGIAP